MSLGLCFWDKECIRKRKEAEAAAQQQIAQQQQALMGVAAQPTGGLKGWAIAAIIGTALLISAIVIIRIKNKKK